MTPANGKVLVNGATGGVRQPRHRHAGAARLPGDGGHRQERRARLPESDRRRRDARRAKPCDMGTRPLEKPLWAAAFDSVGGEQLGWLTRTMQPHGVIASFGNAGGIELQYHGAAVHPARRAPDRRRFGSDADAAAAGGVGAAGRPTSSRAHLDDIATTITLDDLPGYVRKNAQRRQTRGGQWSGFRKSPSGQC